MNGKQVSLSQSLQFVLLFPSGGESMHGLCWALASNSKLSNSQCKPKKPFQNPNDNQILQNTMGNYSLCVYRTSCFTHFEYKSTKKRIKREQILCYNPTQISLIHSIASHLLKQTEVIRINLKSAYETQTKQLHFHPASITMTYLPHGVIFFNPVV